MKKKKLFLYLWLALIVAAPSSAQVTGNSANSKKGAFSTTSRAYLKMGDMRLINNDWGSKQLGCNSYYKIFINDDGSFGWEFNRGNCKDTTGGTPDYPEVEFGIHPFGVAKNLVTSPDFSSTTVLPIQIKDVRSASVKLDKLTIELQKASSWNLDFEMWLTAQHPVTGNHSCAHSEIMTFWGWQDGQWPCDKTGNINAGSNGYALCHYGSGWGCGWNYYQFRVNGGPMRTYTGTLDVKAILDWFVNNQGLSKDLWISRFEVGSEISDNTSGKVTIKNITFEVNGVSKSPEFYSETANLKKPRDSDQVKLCNTIFPAGTSVEFVNMQGVRKTLRTGAASANIAQLSRNLPRGIYLMYSTDKKRLPLGKAVVVPAM